MSGSAHDDRRDAGPTELTAFQSALARLQPAPDGINIAQLLFRAGQLSAARPSRAWPYITAASMLLATVFGSALLFRPAPQPAERIVTVYIPSPTVPPPPQPEPSAPSAGEAPVAPYQPVPPYLSTSDEGSYLHLRREVLTHGLGALPPPSPWPAAAPADDADASLDLPRDSREPWMIRLKHSLHSGGPL
jgi:hypothetical protein